MFANLLLAVDLYGILSYLPEADLKIKDQCFGMRQNFKKNMNKTFQMKLPFNDMLISRVMVEVPMSNRSQVPEL